MKNLFKEAHKMAKEIKNQYPEVDYKFQFSLCLKHLQTVKEESKMAELQGSEKQIEWATSIRETVTSWMNKGIEKAMPTFSESNLKRLEIIKSDMNNNQASFWIENFKGIKDDNLRPLFDYLNGEKAMICGRKIGKAINEIRGF